MVKLKVMAAADIPLGLRLTQLAGWNQTETDWRRFLALAQPGCWVAEMDGQSVATTATFRFGAVGWIAMVLVDPQYRGRGIATILLQHALAWLDAQGVTTVRLDATALGRPVYQRLGFVDEYALARYQGVCPSEPGSVGADVCPADDPTAFASLVELDRRVTATDRSVLLRALVGEPGVTTRVVRRDGRVVGYLMDRPGQRARQVGPCIAADAAAGQALLAEAARRLAGAQVYLDIPVLNQPATRWAEANGLVVERSFQRMCRGPRVADQPGHIWAGSGPEKG